MESLRTRLHAGPLGLAEDLQARGVPARRPAEDYSPAFQVCLPYRGAFNWHVAHDTVLGDANTVLFVRAGETYRVSQPVCGGYGELILTPARDLLAELLQTSPSQLGEHVLFVRRRRVMDPGLLRARADWLHAMRTSAWDALAADEATIRLLRVALAGPPPGLSSPSTARLVNRTKEYLAAHACRPIRLTEIARHAGASPAYLTSAFRRSEGIPVHRYLAQLRLSRALHELPHAADLTALALDLGFASHSHFTLAFRRAFGCTPSAFRRGHQNSVIAAPRRPRHNAASG